MATIAVIDYDMGNLHSACKGLEKAGATTNVTDSPEDIVQADAVVLPGVGAFDPAMQHIRERNLAEPIKNAIASGKPFLGICLGLHIDLDGCILCQFLCWFHSIEYNRADHCAQAEAQSDHNKPCETSRAGTCFA